MSEDLKITKVPLVRNTTESTPKVKQVKFTKKGVPDKRYKNTRTKEHMANMTEKSLASRRRKKQAKVNPIVKEVEPLPVQEPVQEPAQEPVQEPVVEPVKIQPQPQNNVEEEDFAGCF
jgi:hypothetical protein